MRMSFILLLGALCACSKSGPNVSATNASTEEAAKQVKAAGGETAFVTPGEWTSKVTIVSMHVPGATAAEEGRMTGRVSEERQYCLTPEQARKPDENFFAGNENECRYDRFSMGGGKIDAAMRCTHETLTQLMTFNGSYAPDSYQVAMESKVVGGPREMAGMSMSMRADAKRVGECRAQPR